MVKRYENQQCELCKIFSTPSRLKILLNLRDKRLTVSEIVKKTKLRQSLVSQQLSILRSKNILTTEREGKFIYYKIKYPEIMKAFDLMKIVLEKSKRNL